MKHLRIIIVLAGCAAVLGLTSCRQQEPAATSGSEESRQEMPATNTPAPTSGEIAPPAPGMSQPAPSTGGENQLPAAETNQPPSTGPAL